MDQLLVTYYCTNQKLSRKNRKNVYLMDDIH